LSCWRLNARVRVSPKENVFSESSLKIFTKLRIIQFNGVPNVQITLRERPPGEKKASLRKKTAKARGQKKPLLGCG